MTSISERWVKAMVQREGTLIFENRDPCPGEPWSIEIDDPSFLWSMQTMDANRIVHDPNFKYLHVGEA